MKILVSALEASANIHLEALKKELSDSVEFVGIFDKKLGKPLYDITTLAVMGFVDAMMKLPFFIETADKMLSLSEDADKVLLMDSSGFNLPLAKKIKNKFPEKQIIYYILPQAWAWKKGRVKKIEKYCDNLCSILPFEKEIYTQKEKISYVGHPLLDEIKEFKNEISKSGKIAFMPGSRRGEINKLLPVFKKIIKNLKDKQPVLIIPKSFSEEDIKDIYGDISMFEISKDTHKTLSESEFAFICSGTATLEAALIGTPFVLSYIARSVDYFVGKKLVKLDHIGLANIMYSHIEDLGEPFHAEFLQEEVNAQNLLNEYENLDKETFMKKVSKLRDYLISGSSKNVARIIEEE